MDSSSLDRRKQTRWSCVLIASVLIVLGGDGGRELEKCGSDERCGLDVRSLMRCEASPVLANAHTSMIQAVVNMFSACPSGRDVRASGFGGSSSGSNKNRAFPPAVGSALRRRIAVVVKYVLTLASARLPRQSGGQAGSQLNCREPLQRQRRGGRTTREKEDDDEDCKCRGKAGASATTRLRTK